MKIASDCGVGVACAGLLACNAVLGLDPPEREAAGSGAPDAASGSGGSGTGGASHAGSGSVGTSASSGPSSSSTGGYAGAGAVGCADGEREGLLAVAEYPDMAACAGGWSVPGLVSSQPGCVNGTGDDSPNPDGDNCRAVDLCAAGWHVCSTATEVGEKSTNRGCNDVTDPNGSPAFFATSQSGTGATACGAGTNDFFGCGSLGGEADLTTCAPLNRTSGNLCNLLGAPWACGPSNNKEVAQATKSDPTRGGVLCCRD